MILSELILSSFGKFNNRKITLSPGINIIYGSNESGKTTIHKFIEGMFYGYFKSYTKRKIYLDDYYRYYPWDQNHYYGVLKYVHKGEVYRIERNFIKSNDEVKVYDDKTGEDISHLFEYDTTTRMIQPSTLHLGLNSVVYNNTISIKQLGSKTEDDLSKEVKDSLINLGGSLDEDISIKSVIDKLDKKINLIGTKARVKTSPYGKITEELEVLKEERQKSIKINSEIKEHQLNYNKIKSQITELKNKKTNVENKISLLEGLKSKEKYNEAVKLIQEINSLNKEYPFLKEFEKLDPYQYTEGVKLEGTISALKESLNELNNKEEKLRQNIKKIDNKLKDYENLKGLEKDENVNVIDFNYNVLGHKENEYNEVKETIKELENKIKNIDRNTLKKLNEDYFRFEELEEKRHELLYNKDHHTNVSFIFSRLEEKQKHYKRLKLYKLAGLIGILASIALGLKIDVKLYFVALLPLLLMIYSLYSSLEVKKYINKLKYQISEIESKESFRDEEVRNIDIEMDKILSRYNLNNKGDFRRLIGESSMDVALISDNENKINLYNNKLLGLKIEIDDLKLSIIRYLKLLFDPVEINSDNIIKFKSEYNRYMELLGNKESFEEDLINLKEEIESLKIKLSKGNERLEMILSNNNLKDMEEFKDGIEKKQKFENLSQSKESKEKLLKNVLGDNSIDLLSVKASKFKDINTEDIKGLDREGLESSIKDIDKNIRLKYQEITRLEEKINNLSGIGKSLVDIEEEIIRKERVKKDYEEKLKSLELAKVTINKISKEIQRDFAPKLNNKVSDIIKSITNGKYLEVKITENIDVKVSDPSNGKFIEIDKLSGGTIDQLYFSTRLGIIDIIKGENNIPLILDDAFTQYDINRLKNILEYISKEGLKRQIILLTCHNRERRLFDDMNIKYNYVDIS